MIESQKLPMAFSPYEVRLKNAIGKFDEVIVFKVLKMITSSKFNKTCLGRFQDCGRGKGKNM
jgi:hypothetical protein